GEPWRSRSWQGAARPGHRNLPPCAAGQVHRQDPPDPVIEGVMIKRRDSVYQAGRMKGPWFKWKSNPYNVDAVLMYAQRGHGKRSSYY
ncbi:hypothetical protein ACC708_36365, partial [Rhizobium ruizarguesonis]